MDNELVTDSLSDTGGVGGGGSAPIILRYSDYFEQNCSKYMSIGMSCSEFWDGDVCLAKYYRDAFAETEKRINTHMWLQGRYIYEALLAVYPVFNALSSKKEPYPYIDEPLPINEEEARELQERIMRKRAEEQKAKFLAMVENANKKIREKESELNGTV